MKTEEELKKIRNTALENMSKTDTLEGLKYLQGFVAAIDYMFAPEEPKDE